MSEDEDKFIKKKFSVESNCELDSLARIPSLNTSYSTLHSPLHSQRPTEEMSWFTRSQVPGGSEPPHRSHHDDDPPEPVLPRTHGEDDSGTPVRRLKQRRANTVDEYEMNGDNRPPPAPARREYSDMYLESNLRTPRYNTQTSYADMLDNLAQDDPFGGEYKSSGKHKKAKKKSKRGGDSLEGNDSLKSMGQSRKSKKKKKEADSMDSTQTYVIKYEGHTNASYSHAETSSIKSNGTFTVGGKDDQADGDLRKLQHKESAPSPRPAVSRSRMSRKNKRGSTRNPDRAKINKVHIHQCNLETVYTNYIENLLKTVDQNLL